MISQSQLAQLASVTEGIYLEVVHVEIEGESRSWCSVIRGRAGYSVL